MNSNWVGGIVKVYMAGALRISEGLNYANLNYPPGYPLFLALWRLLGISNWQHIRLIQIALDSLTCIPAYLIVRWAHGGRWMALLAALGYAVMPVWASGNGLPLAEALSPALMLWFIWLLATIASRRYIWLWFAAGLMAGAMAMVRYDMLLLVLPALLWALWRAPRRRIFAAGAVLLGFLLITGSWALHNREVHGQWAVSGPDGGYALWSGLGDIPNPYGYFANDARATTMLKSMGLKYGSEPAGRYFTHQYLLAWHDHPGFVIKVAAYRWKQILFPPAWFGPGVSAQFQTSGVGVIQWLLFRYGLYVLVMYLILNRRRLHECFLVILPLAYALGSIGMVHWEERYVTYAYLSYLLAATLLIWRLTVAWQHPIQARLGRLFKGTQQKKVRVVLQCTIPLAVAAVCAAGLSGGALQAAILTKDLDSRIAKGDVQRLDLQDLHFVQNVANFVERQPNGALRLITNRSIQDYQLSAKVPLWDARAAKLDIALTIQKGGAGVGITTPDGSHWLSNYSCSVLGTCKVTLVVLQRYPSVTLVIQNLSPESMQSTISVDAVNVYLVGARPPNHLANSEARRQAELDRLIANGSFSTKQLSEIALRPMAEGVQLKTTGNALNVLTTAERYGYQFGTELDTQGIYAVRVSADLNIKNGGVDMGILSADGKKFLDQAIAAGPGRHSLSLTVFPAGQKHLTLVFSNYRPGGGQSSFELQGLRIMLIRQLENERPARDSATTHSESR